MRRELDYSPVAALHGNTVVVEGAPLRVQE
jgi:hypothetical protein